ncbi:hypothetical protein Sango_0943800 [Sesamum angolense]|uniref:Survival of motor neuron-related-splicing factor 30 n=1 Tax=Sesamum angolense TaxID=2727404 RepID=A0AAE1WYZ1_9LAMI|nr:hypothetical protein Sango_0943800 [Sesamum angolense]
MEGEEVKIEELASNLSTYTEQLLQRRIMGSLEKLLIQALCYFSSLYEQKQSGVFSSLYLPVVRKLLNDDPKNSELLDMEKELVEVITLTEELLATANQSDGNSELVAGTTAEVSPSLHLPGSSSDVKSRSTANYGDKFPVGAKVQAVWSEDGEWFDATIEALTPNGYYVRYDGWGNKEETNSRRRSQPLLEAERIAVATKEALKRKIAQAAAKDFENWTVPQKLRIDPNDPEDVKAAKRKNYMLLSPRCGWKQKKLYRIRGRMPGSNSKQLKAGLKSSAVTVEGHAAEKVRLSTPMSLAASTASFWEMVLYCCAEWSLGNLVNLGSEVRTFEKKPFCVSLLFLCFEALHSSCRTCMHISPFFGFIASSDFSITSWLSVGFFSGRKRESIFKSPDDPFGKVGVTGSGKGLTEFQRREKHLHLKGANIEIADGENVET